MALSVVGVVWTLARRGQLQMIAGSYGIIGSGREDIKSEVSGVDSVERQGSVDGHSV